MGLVGSEAPDGSYSTYHFDVRGSTTAITDVSGTVTDRFSYSSYGTLESHEGGAATPFLYNGLYGVMDDGDGLLYMRARYYAPELRRFLSADPLRGGISDPATLNRYAYANGSPITFMDPFSRSATLISGGHAALDVAGLVPGAGMLFDLANGVWYASEGDWSMAGLSMLGAVPIVGDAATGAKIGVKAVKAGGEALEGAAKLGAKAEKVTKGSARSMADADIANLKKVPKDVIDRMGGEEITQELKQFTGGSKANLYWDKEGNIYAIPNGSDVPTFVTKVQR